MVIAEASTSSDIDLKCAEKVTDSDNEETHEQGKSSLGLPTTPGTCKPKAIKAQRQNMDTALLTYQKIPMYAFNSPKNPTGVLPFQPTGKEMHRLQHEIRNFSFNKFISSGGAFKTMPASPRDIKVDASTLGTDNDPFKFTIKSENLQQATPTIFTFNTAPANSEDPLYLHASIATILLNSSIFASQTH